MGTTTISSGSARLAVRAWGAGERSILALHPSVADSRVWEECARIWAAAQTRVVAYDRRGFGETAYEKEPHDDLEDLRAVTAGMRCRPAVVVGNSRGGALAMELAVAYPEDVLGLVLVGTAPADTPDDLWVLGPTEEVRDAETQAAEQSGDLALVNRLELRYWLDGIGQPEGRVSGAARGLLQEMNATALDAPPVGDRAAPRPVWPVLAEISVPVLIIVGEHDLPGFAAVAAELSERLPHAQVVTLPDTAHVPALDQPLALAETVLTFVGSLP